MSETLFFLLFSVGVMAVMLIDLGIFKKDTSEEVTFKEAGFWTGMWVLLAIIFYIFLGYNGAMVHGITDMQSLKAVQQAYASHIDLGNGPYYEALAAFQNNMSLEFITG